MANMKAHLIAIAIVGVVILLGVILFDPAREVEPKNADENSYFIQIYSASYGGNCNGSDEYEKADDKGVRKKVILSFKRNNRLGRISELCNEETSCVFDVGEKILGSLKSYSCDPALKVKYRCFRVDKLQTANFLEGEQMQLDCRPQTVKERIGLVDVKEPADAS